MFAYVNMKTFFMYFTDDFAIMFPFVSYCEYHYYRRSKV